MDGKIQEDVYFTPKQAADHFNLSLSTVKNYIYSGRLKTLKTPGGHHRIRKSEVLITMGDEEPSVSLEAFCSALLGTLNALGPAGSSLANHCKAVSEMSYKTSMIIGFKDKEAYIVKMAGLVHDIGHICTDHVLLSKSPPLTCAEYEALKKHAEAGRQMLNTIKPFKRIAEIVGQHHERPDGNGYPDGLKGSAIEKAALIIAVAESYDSMVSPYSYKMPVSKDNAVAELLKYSGAQFDKDIVQAFLKII
ncbi:MAG: HD domain-containing phosphohydrolase [Candidatus Omnitrophota bacterium]|nr:HD domain-containing phosphohydrolase [Candidatus Omnitrophota bacterium]